MLGKTSAYPKSPEAFKCGTFQSIQREISKMHYILAPAERYVYSACDISNLPLQRSGM